MLLPWTWKRPDPGSQTFIFWLEMVYGGVLAGSAYLYFNHRQLIPFGDTLGSIPLAVPWFGALGGVVISMAGVAEHQYDWNPRYRFWHWSRPLVGAALGVVSVLILQAGILAVGSSPAGNVGSVPKNLLYYLAAFLVGYREETFRELIKRLTDVLLGSTSTPPPPPTITAVTPDHGALGGGDDVDITGSGFVDVQSVTFGQRASTRIEPIAPSHIRATVPAGATPAEVVVTVRTKTGSASEMLFTYVG
jgi:hypothetical protein